MIKFLINFCRQGYFTAACPLCEWGLIKNMENGIIQDFTTGSVTKKLMRFALPFMLSTLLQTAYSMVDMMVVGHYVRSAGLSAVSIAGQVTWMTTALCMGFTNAGQILVSQLLGAGKRQELEKTIGTLTATVLLCTALVMVLGLSLAKPILRVLSTPEESFRDATVYLLIVFAGTIFTFGYNLVSSIFRGLGDSKHPLLFVAIAAVVNLGLDLFTVAVLGWGVAGAAVATIFGQGVSLVCSLCYLRKVQDKLGFPIRLKLICLDKNVFRQLLKLGVPFALQNAAISISMLFVNRFINSYGLTASATFGTGTKIEQFSWIVINGVMVAGSTMIGQNMGAGKPERMKKCVTVCAVICAVTAVVCMFLFLCFPKQIYSIFTDDPDVLEMAPKFMLALSCSLPATCMMGPYQSFIEGIGNARLVLIIALLDGFVSRIAISLILAYGFHMGLMGWFFGYGMAAYVNTILSGIYYYSGMWKKRAALV